MDSQVRELGIPIVSKCECCVDGSVEDKDHVLAHGPLANEVWYRASMYLGIPYD